MVIVPEDCHLLMVLVLQDESQLFILSHDQDCMAVLYMVLAVLATERNIFPPTRVCFSPIKPHRRGFG